MAPLAGRARSGRPRQRTSNDFTTHTATGVSGPAPFDTGFIAHGQSASIVFTTPGSYEYFCQIHTAMRGTVNVQTVPDRVVPEAPLPALIGGSMMIALIFFTIRLSRSRRLIV